MQNVSAKEMKIKQLAKRKYLQTSIPKDNPPIQAKYPLVETKNPLVETKKSTTNHQLVLF